MPIRVRQRRRATRAAAVALLLMVIFVGGCTNDPTSTNEVDTTQERESRIVVGSVPPVDDRTTQVGEGEVSDGSGPADDIRTLTTISSGDTHTCGLRGDGTAVCWGSNFYGQSTPPEDERFMAITSADMHTCALRLDGTPVCWGADPDPAYRYEFIDYAALVTPPEGERFTDISSSESHSCGLRKNGTLVCWGDYDFKDWGGPPEEERFNHISAGIGITCGITTDRKAACWGARGEYLILELPPEVEDVEHLSGGDDLVCAVLDDSSIHCWDLIGHRLTRGEMDPPKGKNFKVVSMAQGYGCALRLNGSPVCWGLSQRNVNVIDGGRAYSDAYGQNMPPRGEAFTSISAGRLHACGVRANGTAVCWGIDNSRMEYGRYTEITSGTKRTCGIDLRGLARCWGPNSDPLEAVRVASIVKGDSGSGRGTYGLNADGVFVRINSTVRYGHPPPPIDPPKDHKFKIISSGGGKICGIRDDETEYCWPDGSYGKRWQFAEGKFSDISPSTGFRGYVCGLREEGTVVCQPLEEDVERDWGYITPPEDKLFTAISSGGSYTCGLDKDGAASCWGAGYVDRYPPPVGERFIAISSGSAHTCALREDGTPVCWGYEGANATSPPADEKFVSISSGYNHSCGLREDDSVACWGWEDFGQARPPEEVTGQTNEGR